MKKIIGIFALVTASGCYVPSGMYRLTEAKFNGAPQPEKDCSVMIVKDDVLVCVPEYESE